MNNKNYFVILHAMNAPVQASYTLMEYSAKNVDLHEKFHGTYTDCVASLYLEHDQVELCDPPIGSENLFKPKYEGGIDMFYGHMTLGILDTWFMADKSYGSQKNSVEDTLEKLERVKNNLLDFQEYRKEFRLEQLKRLGECVHLSFLPKVEKE